ncbi:MFS transporter [Kibdelosporangium aridum]|uniref:Predicted arabinose efflux permease, MFS family n=1 Tax=Kibdelosporangium aridum TaxID=2030 RepID=A0A1Y5X599_KIBAR|nr:MFS transporter [Kibdelosporangium aridum]SMC71417.1 Predicted arabinose efflux permease, MFS family [Kibdelosporangium aridum]
MRKWGALTAISLGSLLFLIDTTAVTVALPDIGRSFEASLTPLQWVLNIYTAVLAALMLVAGSVADRYGHRAIYLAGLTVFTAASLVCGLTPGIAVLIAARGVQGVGGAAVAVTTFALIGSSYAGRDRGIAMGIWGAVNGLAAAAGPIAGGLLTQYISWRAIFIVNVPLALLAIALTVRSITVVPGVRGKRFDMAGLVSLFRIASFNALMVCGVISASVFACLVFTSVWLQGTLKLGPVDAGLALVPLALSTFVTSTLVGRRLQHIPPRVLIGIGLLLGGAGCALQAGLDAGSTALSILCGLIVTGVGVGVLMPAMGTALFATVPPQRFGVAVGASTTARQLGQTLGVAVLGVVFQSGVDAVDGLNRVYLVAAGLGFAAAATGFLLIRENVGTTV